jgi:REP element-mobilizing transposase RayT
MSNAGSCSRAAREGDRIEEEHLRPDHVHMMIALPPKYAVSQVIGYIKGTRHSHALKRTGINKWQAPLSSRSLASRCS